MIDLNEIFEYKDGILIWKNCKKSSHTGRPAGSLRTITKRNPNPGLDVRLGGRCYQVHRLIWEMHYGPIPALAEVDHKDGDGLNNRIENLRLASRSQNQRNVGLTRRNSTGFKGVSYFRDSGKFRADIHVNGKTKYLGQFETATEAHFAYVTAAKKLHGEFYKCDCQYCSAA